MILYIVRLLYVCVYCVRHNSCESSNTRAHGKHFKLFLLFLRICVIIIIIWEKVNLIICSIIVRICMTVTNMHFAAYTTQKPSNVYKVFTIWNIMYIDEKCKQLPPTAMQSRTWVCEKKKIMIFSHTKFIHWFWQFAICSPKHIFVRFCLLCIQPETKRIKSILIRID